MLINELLDTYLAVDIRVAFLPSIISQFRTVPTLSNSCHNTRCVCTVGDEALWMLNYVLNSNIDATKRSVELNQIWMASEYENKKADIFFYYPKFRLILL